jgi:hypothetical protein
MINNKIEDIASLPHAYRLWDCGLVYGIEYDTQARRLR